MSRLCFHLLSLLALIRTALAVPLPGPEGYFVSFSDRSSYVSSDDDIPTAPPLFLLFGLLLLFMICLLLYMAQRFDHTAV